MVEGRGLRGAHAEVIALGDAGVGVRYGREVFGGQFWHCCGVAERDMVGGDDNEERDEEEEGWVELECEGKHGGSRR